MKSLSLVCTVALAMWSYGAAAATQTYVFINSNGTAYCDGIQIDASGGVAVGKHIYNQSNGCQYPSADIGGVEGTLPTLGRGKWYSLAESEATGDSLPTDYTTVIYANLHALTWRMAVESTNYGVSFKIVFNGTLKKTTPSAFLNSGGRETLLSAAKLRLSPSDRK